jgi:glycosyltransferase involved in cell wall biosynthesis
MRIVFNYSTVNIGGAQLLFARICKFFSEKNISVAVISNNECFLSKFLVESNVNFELIDSSSINLLDKDDVLVLSLAQVYMYEKVIKLGAQTRVFFWDLHEHNIIQWMSFFPVYKRNSDSQFSKLFKLFEQKRINKNRNFFYTAHLHKSLVFMCKKNFKTNNDFFDLQLEPTYVPIPIDNTHHFQRLSVDSTRTYNKEINIGWMSRLASDKVRILVTLIKDLEQYKQSVGNNCQIRLHVIGDGPASNLVSSSESIQILCKGRIDGTELGEYMDDNIDIGFSMGTSAFEFASRGIPSVFVPNTTATRKVLNQHRKYLWIFDVEGYDVAAEGYYKEKTMNVASILDELKREPVKLSKLSIQHLQSNHSLEAVGERLLGFINNAHLTGSDMVELKLNEQTLFERFLFSIKQRLKRFLGKKL